MLIFDRYNQLFGMWFSIKYPGDSLIKRSAVQRDTFTKSTFFPAVLLVLFLSLPYSIAYSETTDSTLTLLSSGDTMLGSWAETVMIDSGYGYPFGYIQEYIEGSDIFFTNLEAPFGTGGTPFDKKFNFRVKPDLVKVLLAGGINLVSLANNHTMDYGPECLQQTLEILTENNIAFAGAGLDLATARKAAQMTVNGMSVGFLSYTMTFPEEFWASDTTGGTCFPYEEYVFNDVRAASDSNDFLIVSCHWGQELRETPKPYQTKMAHRLIDNGADIILGHHPHIVQGIEIYKEKPIIYSLGNFIFGSYSENARDSFLAKFKLRKNKKIVTQILPISVYNKVVEFRPVPLEGAAKTALFDHVRRLSSELNADSLGISNDGFVTLIKS